jgi:hypothetical protein
MSKSRRLLSLFTITAVIPLGVAASGCGGSDDSASASDSAKAGAKSLTQAMNRASTAFDDIGSTRASLDRFGQDIGNPISQTGDVIALLGTGNDAEKVLLTAARQQRTFLQTAKEAATSRTRAAAVRAADNARSAGKRAVASYSRVIAESDELAGLVPPATTFNTSNLRNGVVSAWGSSSSKKSSGSSKTTTSKTTTSSGSAATDCGGGVTAGNAATSCPFARNVADNYRGSGGSTNIDVFSPVTGRNYVMRCVGAAPVVCTGGNGAVVKIR